MGAGPSRTEGNLSYPDRGVLAHRPGRISAGGNEDQKIASLVFSVPQIALLFRSVARGIWQFRER